ncbi:MAG TPA: hypothetical protein VG982_01870 [Candidatus Paceibacterota bacterium]|nr:hypothetical protein [Candidatus Paceibacterota bacterium]
MYNIVRIKPGNAYWVCNFQLVLDNQYKQRTHRSLNEKPLIRLRAEIYRYAAGLKLLFGAFVPSSNELIGYIIGYPPSLALEYRYRVITRATLPSQKKFKETYINFLELLREDYFLTVNASFKEGVNQKDIMTNLLKKLTEEANRQQFTGILFTAQRHGMKTFLPVVNFNLIDTVQFKTSEPFTNIYYKCLS